LRKRISLFYLHVPQTAKVKKTYSECIWRFDARESKTVKSSCKYHCSGKNERN
jgi:hypothetical protein